MLTIQRRNRHRAPRPPGHLSPVMQKWWCVVHKDYELSDHHCRILENAATAWDRSEQARLQILADGIVIVDAKGKAWTHPAVSIELQSRKLFNACVRELGLDVKAPDAPRAPLLPAYRREV